MIIDDEDHIRESLKGFSERYCPQVQVIGEASSYREAREMIPKLNPDLLFLDIQLGDGNGIDLLSEFESPDFKVIFITAHDQYAIDAFKVSAVDFILKPVNPLALSEAVERARQILKHELELKLEALGSNLSSDKKSSRKFIIKTNDNIYLLEMNTVTHLSSDGSYTEIFTTDQGTIISSRPLRDFEEMLMPYAFYRIHRSFIINLAHVKRYEKAEGGFVVLTNDLKIPVASRKQVDFVSILDQLTE